METTPITATPPSSWLREKQERGTTTAEALAFFDSLPTVTLDSMLGRWRGSGFGTGHPFDGLLEAFGWYGKEFLGPDAVHPLLFDGGGGRILIVNPKLMPMDLTIKYAKHADGKLSRAAFAATRSLLTTTEPRARMRMMEHRGKVSATMIYDDLPVHDIFRRVDADTLLGVMDARGLEQPFFFVLRRDR